MRRRNYTKELKESILNEVKEVGNVSLVARKHGISQSTIRTWIKKSKQKYEIKVKPGRKALIEGQNNFEKEISEITQENDTLKKILGEKDLEIAILKDLIKKASPQLKIK
ncbi:transposase [Clostridium sporogenes]|uniref:transposase n=1 Tax=Clostridium sporogenes TaxID=1509 RepID=UPI002239137C|nr:transposase [Clostridium sporogenes]MCW6077974.1 transposase [Clostridium sporogenes]